MDEFLITKIEAWPISLPLREPFVVATGTMSVADNVFIRVQLQSGICGLGEMAPFPDISGETQAGCLDVFRTVAPLLLGQSVLQWRRLAHELAEATSVVPSVRCGLETALLDAFARAINVPLWALWGGADVRVRETDVTLAIGAIEPVLKTAEQWFTRGFRVFKMKVGQDVDKDIRRVEAVWRAFPRVSFVIDGNQGFTAKEALDFLRAISRLHVPVILFEQPVSRDDWDGLLEVHRKSAIPIAADESVRSFSDARRLIEADGVDVINIKITKCGVRESLDIVNLVRRAGLDLMIGGMVESRVAMGCSFSLVLGLGGFEFIDLDMPLLLTHDPAKGGYRYEGCRLYPWASAGLGQELDTDQSSFCVIS